MIKTYKQLISFLQQNESYNLDSSNFQIMMTKGYYYECTLHVASKIDMCIQAYIDSYSIEKLVKDNGLEVIRDSKEEITDIRSFDVCELIMNEFYNQFEIVEA